MRRSGIGRRGRWAALVLLAVAAAACAPDAGDGQATTEAARGDPAPTASERHPLDVRRVDSRGLDSVRLDSAFARASGLSRLHCLVVARHGAIVRERCFRGRGIEAHANVKSVSKSIVSALVGIAIAEGDLTGPEQPVAPFFAEYDDPNADPRKASITVGNLLSMQSGLERTSGGNYGRWVTSPNWVRYAWTRPMSADPGGRMLYSTGNTHLLSALLTEATGESTWRFARSRLAEPLGITLPSWPADPQGIYFGGNEMRVTPRGMVRFGELYRNGGAYGGRQIVPAAWVRESLVPRTVSPWSGQSYGYGWFLTEMGGHPLFYAWGYGGQFIFVVPDLELTVVTTSAPDAPREEGHLESIRALLRDHLVPAAQEGAG